MARTRLTDLAKEDTSETTQKAEPVSSEKDGRSRPGTGLFRDNREALAHAVHGIGAKVMVKTVDPRECIPFVYNDREYASLVQADIQDLIDGFLDPVIGQLEPCVARQASMAAANHKYEIVAGTRRLKAAMWIVEHTSVKFHLQIIVHQFNDVEALQAMRGENSYNPPSPYERAISTRRHIDELFGGNLSEYARVMHISKAAISNLMAFTQIPDICLDAYASRRVIPIEHALTIRTRLNKHEATPAWKKALVAKASEFAKTSEKLEPAQVLSAMLKTADVALKQKKVTPEKIGLAIGGKKNALAVTRFHDGSVTFQLNSVCFDHQEETLKVLQQQIQKK
jgi:ParB/RepB/Spo0J family partition protein